MLQSRTGKISEEMALQVNKDLTKNAFTGSYIYLLLWVAIIIPSRFYITAPEISFCFTIIFVLLAFARISLIFNFKTIYHKNQLLWKTLFYPTVLAAALCWGVLCAISLVAPVFKDLSLVIIISTAGMAGGGIVAFIPSRAMTIALITAYLVPTELIIFFSHTAPTSISIVFLVYWIGMFGITKTQHKTYWLSITQSFLIKKHAIELEKLNTIDGLTGLKNRSFFDETIKNELKRAIRKKTYLSLLLIDIDHFKEVNDHHGHLVGDDCLRFLSKLLQQQAKRDTDTVARYGGEEFAIILPDENEERAKKMAEKIRKTVETDGFSKGTIHIALTVSIGIASVIPEPGYTEEMIFEIADTALYKAKNNGRNQVVI